MEVRPDQLQFETQPQGKPVLITASSFPIQFNVSHTRGVAFIALTTQHAVGIDVEWIDRKVQDRDIAERYFPTRESEYQFFSYWTCKEAYLKMQGRGIAEGLAQCEITMNPDQLQVRLAHVNQKCQGEDCSLYRITSGSGHVGAVAIACPSAQVSYWNWEEKYLP
jgi:4'-phosphopantetheinyl transferase